MSEFGKVAVLMGGPSSERRIRSRRPQPLQPTMSNAASDAARSSVSFASGSPQGQKYFVSFEKYLAW